MVRRSGAPRGRSRRGGLGRRHLGVRPLFLIDGPHVGAPEVSPVARRHTPTEAFALDNASARVIIGA